MNKFPLTLFFASCWQLCLITDTFGQGALTPSAAPTPTMKTLDQIEPRVPISASTIIGAAGSYYLTKSISVSAGNGFVITANNVTLDLNGFTIFSNESPANPNNAGILLGSALSDITILNGNIAGNITYTAAAIAGLGSAVAFPTTVARPATYAFEGSMSRGLATTALTLISAARHRWNGAPSTSPEDMES